MTGRGRGATGAAVRIKPRALSAGERWVLGWLNGRPTDAFPAEEVLVRARVTGVRGWHALASLAERGLVRTPARRPGHVVITDKGRRAIRGASRR